MPCRAPHKASPVYQIRRALYAPVTKKSKLFKNAALQPVRRFFYRFVIFLNPAKTKTKLQFAIHSNMILLMHRRAPTVVAAHSHLPLCHAHYRIVYFGQFIRVLCILYFMRRIRQCREIDCSVVCLKQNASAFPVRKSVLFPHSCGTKYAAILSETIF